MTKKKEPKPPPQKMTDEEVTKLARDLVTNQVFMSDQCRRMEDIRMVFMVLMFLKKKDLKKMADDGVAHFWEYNKEALPRSVNGYPMFTSCRQINSTDYKRVQAEEARMRKALGE